MSNEYISPQEQRQTEQILCEEIGKTCDFGICDECPVTGGDKDKYEED